MARRRRGGHEISDEAATLIIENIESRRPAKAPPLRPEAPSRHPIGSSATPLLNRGPWRFLELLKKTLSVRDPLALYEQAIRHPVYLRPTAKGLTVMSLDPSTPAMVGVGGAGNCCIDTLPPTPAFVASAALAYRAKVSAMVRESAEERQPPCGVDRFSTAGLPKGLAATTEAEQLHPCAN